MLTEYKNLFDHLNEKKEKYIIYKSLNHLKEDLNGERGDIDILINNLKYFEHIVRRNGWIKIIKKDYPFYYFKLSKNTNLMLDVDNKIRLGEKPFRPYYFLIDIDRLQTVKFENTRILSNEDYVPLMFLMRTTSASDKKENLTELQNLIRATSVDGYMKELIERVTNAHWAKIEKDILQANTWVDLKEKYKKTILKNSQVNYVLLLKQKMHLLISKFYSVKKRVFKTPSYRVREKGYLVAFMGNDGAGKSSTIEYIQNIDYFKYTGIKMIYFGNNHYVLPFLNQVMKRHYRNKFFRLILSLLASIDKQMRSIIAKYYISVGYIVLADRYFYDEMMAIEYTKVRSPHNIFKNLYKWLTAPRIIIKPEITFFLDVDPEVAYKRKQDYAYEIVVDNIQRYRQYLSTVDKVERIDANQQQEKVIRDVVKRLYEKDIAFNSK
jgi:thymidylate kinase